MSPLTREQAKHVIADVREENGGISAEDRAKTPPRVLKALESVCAKLSAATSTLATNLYSRETRFVYELIQNAEDNSYTLSPETEPFLIFTIEKDRIVIDSNEDGFISSNVKAICSTGQSTKTSSQGYIGEKGIGFKSVFKVASKVHIQSGPFSFAFFHTRESDGHGLGMVTPYDEEYEELPDGVRTRMTLILKRSPMTEERCNELFNIPNTLLLFLSKLKKIQINREFPNEKTSTIYGHRFDSTRKLAIASETTFSGSDLSHSDSTELLFKTFKRNVTGLPYDEARADNHTDRATVVLAFPVDVEEKPVVDNQYVFAFLPLRRCGFTFLIQADFITQASREDIFDSERNQQLLFHVAETYREAIRQFCQHPTLVYDWIKYLPDDSISDAFWRNLRPQIISLLADTPILRTQSKSVPPKFQKPSQVRFVGGDFIDEAGDPLFADLDDTEIYISRKYSSKYRNGLRSLGVETLDWDQALARVSADLQGTSRLRSRSENDDWHKRVAKFLSTPWKKLGMEGNRNLIQRLPLIPLDSGRWATAWDSPIYFPTVGTSQIPQDLGFKLVPQTATKPEERAQLFRYLGVKNCSTGQVISSIYQKYAQNDWEPEIPQVHIRYVFENLSEAPADVNAKIWIKGDRGERVWLAGRQKEHMYFRDRSTPYEPGNLFPGTHSRVFGGIHEVHFIHPCYMSHHKDGEGDENLFRVWLETVMGVKSIPHLIHHSRNELSVEFKHIISHRRECLLGVLKRYWSTYECLISKYGIREALQNSKVPVEGHAEIGTLRHSYLPLPELKSIVARAKVDPGPLFLKMPNELQDQDQEEWAFLKKLAVGIYDDVRFYLYTIQQQKCLPSNAISQETTMPIYAGIANRCITLDDKALVRETFKEHNLICLAKIREPGQIEWLRNDDCVWSGPLWLTAKRRLDGAYGTLTHLFKDTLSIRDFNWRDCLLELKSMRSTQENTSTKASEIYHWLMLDFLHHENGWEELRLAFKELQLVFVPEVSSWHDPSDCIWAERRIRVPQKHSIATSYASLTDFFTKMLGIRRPDLRMHVQTLRELGGSKDKRDQWLAQVKDAMMLISLMDPKPGDVTSLRAANIFPVKNRRGQILPTKSEVEFAIVDRPEFEGLFPNIVVLNFTLQEVHTYKKFLSAMGLDKRRISNSVEEGTNVDGGVLDDKLTQILRSRAYALFRCAVFYNSTKTREHDLSLFGQLRQAETLTSERISKSMTLMQNSQEHVVKQQKANFHLDESSDRLRLYVPRKEAERELCYLRQLPRRLLQFLAISDPTAEAVIGGIVRSSRLSIVDEILKDAGVIEIDGVNRPPEEDDDLQHVRATAAMTSMAFASAHLTRSISPPSSCTSDIITADPSLVQDASSRLPTVRDQALGSPRLRPQTSPSPAPSFAEDRRYAALLDRLILAGSHATIPNNGSASYSNTGHHPIEVFAPIFGYRSLERDRKVGAAGELFVFELLSQLDLPSFGPANWQSTIRSEVTVHVNYENLGEWHGYETADITYNDIQNKLVNLLAEKGYDMLQDRTQVDCPKCFIEVKTTTAEWDEPFYVSRAQYDRMCRMQWAANRPWNEIYILVRVFNVEREKMGLRIYVDPASAKDRGDLDFVVDTWRVRPAG